MQGQAHPRGDALQQPRAARAGGREGQALASRSLVECQGYFQPCPGGNVIVIDDATFAMRYARPYYYYSEAVKDLVRDYIAKGL